MKGRRFTPRAFRVQARAARGGNARAGPWRPAEALTGDLADSLLDRSEGCSHLGMSAMPVVSALDAGRMRRDRPRGSLRDPEFGCQGQVRSPKIVWVPVVRAGRPGSSRRVPTGPVLPLLGIPNRTSPGCRCSASRTISKAVPASGTACDFLAFMRVPGQANRGARTVDIDHLTPTEIAASAGSRWPSRSKSLNTARDVAAEDGRLRLRSPAQSG